MYVVSLASSYGGGWKSGWKWRCSRSVICAANLTLVPEAERETNKLQNANSSRIFASIDSFTTRARPAAAPRLPTPEYRPTPNAKPPRVSIASVHPARAVWGLGAPLAVRASTFRTNNARDGSSQRQLFGRPPNGVCRRRSGTGGCCLPTPNRDYQYAY